MKSLTRLLMLSSVAALITLASCQSPVASTASELSGSDSRTLVVPGLKQVMSKAEIVQAQRDKKSLYFRTESPTVGRRWMYIKHGTHLEVAGNWDWATTAWNLDFTFQWNSDLKIVLRNAETGHLIEQRLTNYIDTVYEQVQIKDISTEISTAERNATNFFAVEDLGSGRFALKGYWNYYIEGQPWSWQVGARPNYTTYKGAAWTIWTK